MHQELREIDDWPGYFVSRCGNLFSTKQGPLRKLSVRANGAGYLQTRFSRDGKLTNVRVHRLVATAFLSRQMGKDLVCHKNDIKTDNRVENLYWGDTADNVQDLKRNGRGNLGKPGAKGESNPVARLNWEKVKAIRAAYETNKALGRSQYKLRQHFSEIFGVHPDTIGHVTANRTWKTENNKGN